MALQHPVDTPPAELLRTAREAAWSDDESAAPEAYDCAIKAIEQAFRQIATPDNPTDDLGVILAHWENRPDLWNSCYPRLSDLDPVMSLLHGLWQAPDQHDDLFPLRLEDARIAVTIAEAVVSLVQLGFFELLDELTPEEEAEDLRIAEESLAWYEEHGRDDTIPWEEVRAEWAAQDAKGQ